MQRPQPAEEPRSGSLADRARGQAALVVTAGARACALPLEHVAETMRPLPIVPVAGMPPFVLGLSVLRGVPTPVVDLGALLETGDGDPPGRFVTLRVGERFVALAVRSVAGVTELDAAWLSPLPPLMAAVEAGGSAPTVALAQRDGQLFLVLQASRLLPEQAGQAPAVLAERP